MTRAPWHYLLALSAILLGALAFRLPDPALRPLHGDEAINTFKTHELHATGSFEYDPDEYHGPTLYFFSLPSLWLAGGDYAKTTEASFRILTVLFGVATLALLFFLRQGLGRAETLVAALLAAISPALVFYNRYYIHESLLVFFTFLAIVFGWRYARSRRIGWALACGVAVGLMHATKETFVIAIAGMIWGLIGMLAWAWLIDRESPRPRRPLRRGGIVAALVVGLSVSVLFFSSFGRNARGPLDSVLTYVNYFQRGTSHANDHNKPFPYYFKLLLWTQPVPGRSPVTSEALIVALAAVGAVAALARKGSKLAGQGARLVVAAPLTPALSQEERENGADVRSGDNDSARLLHWDERRHWLLRFLVFYILSTALFYSVIKYKTPWCMMTFLHAMTLLAGVGAAAIVRWMPHLVLSILVALLLSVATAQLAWQAYRTSYVYPDDYRRNAYVYSQPLRQVFDFASRVDDIAAVHPDPKRFQISVLTRDAWPLPWYLRKYPSVSYADGIPVSPDADVIVIALDQIDELEEKIDPENYQVVHYGLRPTVPVRVYYRKKLWTAMIQKMRSATTSPSTPPSR